MEECSIIENVTVAEALAVTLREWGIESVFGVSGANIEDFHDAIHRHGGRQLRSVAARSEIGAAFMADAQARSGAPLGVCCSTSGGGMMNLAVGVAESYQEGIPVLAIVGQVSQGLNGVGGFQDSSGIGHTVDAEKLWTAISKSTKVIKSAERFWDDLREVVSAALSPRRGPGVLLVPKDLFQALVPPRPVNWPRRLVDVYEPALPTSAQVSALEDALGAASNPVLIVGPGVRAGAARNSVVEFARRVDLPVATSLSDVACFPNHDPLFLGVVGAAGHPSVHQYINETADLVVVLGSHLEVMQRAAIGPGLERAKLVFINDELGLSRNTFPSAEFIEVDINGLFEVLLKGPLNLQMFRGRPAGYRHLAYTPTLAEPVPVDDVLPAEECLLQSEAISRIQEVLADYGRLVFDAGNCAASALHYLTSHEELETSIALGMGGMGYAIPAAVGASMNDGDFKRTMVICGDGAFLMQGMEVHTAVEQELPILFVVFNNAKHGMCVTRQQVYFDGRIECASYAEPSIAQMSRGFGESDALWVGRAGTLAELDAAFDALSCWDWDGPAVLELTLRREEVPPFAPFLPADAPQGHSRPALVNS